MANKAYNLLTIRRLHANNILSAEDSPCWMTHNNKYSFSRPELQTRHPFLMPHPISCSKICLHNPYIPGSQRAYTLNRGPCHGTRTTPPRIKSLTSPLCPAFSFADVDTYIKLSGFEAYTLNRGLCQGILTKPLRTNPSYCTL